MIANAIQLLASIILLAGPIQDIGAWVNFLVQIFWKKCIFFACTPKQISFLTNYNVNIFQYLVH